MYLQCAQVGFFANIRKTRFRTSCEIRFLTITRCVLVNLATEGILVKENAIMTLLMGAIHSSQFQNASQRSRTVREDWLAQLPEEMHELFNSTRNELENCDVILSVALDEALALCARSEFDKAEDHAELFAGLFDLLARRLLFVIGAIEKHIQHSGIAPNVTSVDPASFRSSMAQRLTLINSLLVRLVFRARPRFTHKLHLLHDIIEELQLETRERTVNIRSGAADSPVKRWHELEILAYDLSTCLGETTIVLKSCFCALPESEFETFRLRLTAQACVTR
jgi:hypothetical protein